MTERKKIGLIDVDGHNFPNLALMKLSSYHRMKGDNVEWHSPSSHYEIVYKAKVFTFTKDYSFPIDADEIITGGTGYDTNSFLPDKADGIQPDYWLYHNSKFYDSSLAYGFLTRGCPNKCSWCIVPKKEGSITPYMDVEEVALGRKKLILMDNNILTSDYGLSQIEKIVRLGYRIDFNQGLDARIIASNPEIAKLLSKVKWIRFIRLACDTQSSKEPLLKAVEALRSSINNSTQFFVYVLLNTLPDSYDRINFCRQLNLYAFAQPYRDFTPNQIIPQWQKDMARYTNLKWLYKSIDFKEFIPRKNFICSSYF